MKLFIKSLWNRLSKGSSSKIDAHSPMPTHVGIIMDGNGRWAKKRNLPRLLGHNKGVETVRLIVKLCGELGISCLTLYAFSYENWSRPKIEVDGLLDLIRQHLVKELEDLHKNGVRIQVIGEKEMLPEDIQNIIKIAEDKTQNNRKLILLIALSYSSRQEIVASTKKLLTLVNQGELSIEDINQITFSSLLYTGGHPDPDLIIRTSGEQRLSNFLLWQAAYSELYFSSLDWPEFSRQEFIKAIQFYQSRNRRYGNI